MHLLVIGGMGEAIEQRGEPRRVVWLYNRILIEHTHRLVATTVGLLTIALLVQFARARPRDPGAVRLGGGPESITIVPRSGIALTVALPGEARRPSCARLSGDARFVFEGVLAPVAYP